MTIARWRRGCGRAGMRRVVRRGAAGELVNCAELVEENTKSRMDIPEAGMEAAMEVMRSGRLFRYTQPAETSQVSQAEVEFAEMVGQKYALG